VYYELGDLSIKEKKYEKAIYFYEKALRKDYAKYYANHFIGYSYFRLNNFTQSKIFLNRALLFLNKAIRKETTKKDALEYLEHFKRMLSLCKEMIKVPQKEITVIKVNQEAMEVSQNAIEIKQSIIKQAEGGAVGYQERGLHSIIRENEQKIKEYKQEIKGYEQEIKEGKQKIKVYIIEIQYYLKYTEVISDSLCNEKEDKNYCKELKKIRKEIEEFEKEHQEFLGSL
jgi:tetratricopeptide (TPR) repeat protein